MVRMSDLVRGPAAAPPLPPIEEEPEELFDHLALILILERPADVWNV